jgi:anaerobic selenocysteine-containing dehydrogenase
MVVGGTSCVFYMNWWEGEPYLTRAFLINAANPVRHYYPDTYWKETLSNPNVELVVMLEVLPSDTAPYADVILPNSTCLERDEPTLYGNGVNHDLGADHPLRGRPTPVRHRGNR